MTDDALRPIHIPKGHPWWDLARGSVYTGAPFCISWAGGLRLVQAYQVADGYELHFLPVLQPTVRNAT
jgi:hypothetical protein